MINEDLVNQ